MMGIRLLLVCLWTSDGSSCSTGTCPASLLQRKVRRSKLWKPQPNISLPETLTNNSNQGVAAKPFKKSAVSTAISGNRALLAKPTKTSVMSMAMKHKTKRSVVSVAMKHTRIPNLVESHGEYRGNATEHTLSNTQVGLGFLSLCVWLAILAGCAMLAPYYWCSDEERRILAEDNLPAYSLHGATFRCTSERRSPAEGPVSSRPAETASREEPTEAAKAETVKEAA